MINIYIYSYLIVVLPKRVLVSETLILESINMLYSLGFHKWICRATQNWFFSLHLEKNEKPRESSKIILDLWESKVLAYFNSFWGRPVRVDTVEDESCWRRLESDPRKRKARGKVSPVWTSSILPESSPLLRFGKICKL